MFILDLCSKNINNFKKIFFFQFSIVCNKIVYNVNIHILKCVYWKYSPLVVIYNLSRLRLSRLYVATRGEYFQYTHFKMWILSHYKQFYYISEKLIFSNTTNLICYIALHKSNIHFLFNNPIYFFSS